MAFSSGRKSIGLEELLLKINELEIVSKYLGITEVPCVICSPLRPDKSPSLSIYMFRGRLRYRDFGTGEKGGLFDLLSQMWQLSYEDTLQKVVNDFTYVGKDNTIKVKRSVLQHRVEIKEKPKSKIEIKIRNWRLYDILYWRTYGVSVDWLKYAEVYPISHKIITKGDQRFVFGADKYAYAYIERKEGNISIKIYQPFNKDGFKWCTSTDSSVISLWTKVPPEGDKLCICSSLKDALCLWSNTGIPCLATQGEGYTMSNTAINELKRRYKQIFILFDNDSAGLIDGEKLSKQTGFINLVLPKFENGKDVSDLYRSLNDKQKFKDIILSLFNNKK
jgi:hypothetical protein